MRVTECGPEAVAASRLSRERKVAAAEVVWFRRACRASQGPSSGGFVGNVCQRKYGEVEKVRQRRINGQSSGDHAKESRTPPREALKCTSGRKPQACCLARMAIALAACGIREKVAKRAGTPGISPAFAVTISSVFFLLHRRPWGSENPRRPRRLFL